MAKKKTKSTRKSNNKKSPCTINVKEHCNSCGAYFLGIIGAAVYYISTATGFWNGVVGLLKAIVWPAFLVFELLKFLGA